jgi:hypothetical protein
MATAMATATGIGTGTGTKMAKVTGTGTVTKMATARGMGTCYIIRDAYFYAYIFKVLLYLFHLFTTW